MKCKYTKGLMTRYKHVKLKFSNAYIENNIFRYLYKAIQFV